MSVACSFEDGVAFDVRAGETLLDACRRAAVEVPFSCRSGICRTCMLRAVHGRVPAAAQAGLPDELRGRSYLLACQCVPVEPLVLARTDARDRLPPPPRTGEPAPDPALWRELGEGKVVRSVLEAFYARVYADERLAPFFHGVTMSRSIDKQYSFMKQLMTGERVYFGDRPRNAHHWMVIDEALFDYRAVLMREVLAAQAVSQAQQERWLRLENHYRGDIVKAAPWPRNVGGLEQPADGYGREVLGEATLCDHCGQALEAGVEVSYHLRLGTVSCDKCTGRSWTAAN